MKKNVIHRYLSSRVLPIWTILLIDVLIIVLSCLMAYALRYDFRSIFLETSTIDRTIIWTILANLICFPISPKYCIPAFPCGCCAHQCTLYGLYHQFCYNGLLAHRGENDI